MLQYIPDTLRSAKYLPALETLVLSSNKLTFLESETFTNLSTLVSLYVFSSSNHAKSTLIICIMIMPHVTNHLKVVIFKKVVTNKNISIKDKLLF